MEKKPIIFVVVGVVRGVIKHSTKEIKQLIN